MNSFARAYTSSSHHTIYFVAEDIVSVDVALYGRIGAKAMIVGWKWNGVKILLTAVKLGT